MERVLSVYSAGCPLVAELCRKQYDRVCRFQRTCAATCKCGAKKIVTAVDILRSIKTLILVRIRIGIFTETAPLPIIVSSIFVI